MPESESKQHLRFTKTLRLLEAKDFHVDIVRDLLPLKQEKILETFTRIFRGGERRKKENKNNVNRKNVVFRLLRCL